MQKKNKFSKKIIYFPARFPAFFFFSLFIYLFFEDGFFYLGLFLWPYSFSLFWREDKFYAVAGKRSYRFSFVTFLNNFKVRAKKKSLKTQKLIELFISVIFLSLLSFIFKAFDFIPFILLGFISSRIDFFLRRKFTW